MKRLKIAYIAPRFIPFQGGGEKNIYSIALRMAKLGHDVTVYTANIKYYKSEPLPPYRETIEGMKIIRNWALNESLYAGFYPSLFPLLLLNKYDLIHTSGIGFIWREFCLIIKRILSPNTGFIVTPHGPFMALNDTTGVRGFVKKYYTKVLKIILPKIYDRVIEVNPKQDSWISSEYNISKDKIRLVPNGIDESYIESKIIEHDPEEQVVITYLNRWEKYKGIQEVITALSIIRDKKLLKNNYKLPLFYVMGRPGNYKDELYKLVEDLKLEENVKFIISPTDSIKDEIFYKQSQINVLTSQYEGYGITLTEAMAKGNVVITTYGNEGADLFLIPGVTGYMYNYLDIEKLSEIIALLINDPTLRKKIREENIRFIKKLTWESVFPKYLDIVNELI